MDRWIDSQPEHVRFDDMVAFQAAGYPRKSADLKQIRLVLVDAILGSTRSWEALVGRVIAGAEKPDDGATPDTDSLQAYLGAKTCSLLLPAADAVAAQA